MTAMHTCFTIVGSLIAALLIEVASPAHARRIALVVGNSTYQHTRALPNAANDATAIGIALERIGFKVSAANNLDQRAMIDVLRRFGKEAADSEMAVIFFAGHGLEIAGDNWLIPVSAELRHERDLQYEAVHLKLMLEAVAGAARLRLIILDACRNNPLGERMQVVGNATRAANARGLGRVEPTGDVLVVYSAKHGTVAEDGPPGGNSPFAEALITNLPTPALDVRILFGRVTDTVRSRTGGRQEPFTYGSVGGAEISLAPGGSAPGTPRPTADDRAVEAWRRIENSKDVRDFQAFRDQFGTSSPFYSREAEKRIAALEAESGQTSQDRKRLDDLRQKEEQLRVRERELDEARLKLKEEELQQREKRLEEERERVAATPAPANTRSAAPEAGNSEADSESCAEYRRRATYNEEIGRPDRAKYWWDRYEDCRTSPTSSKAAATTTPGCQEYRNRAVYNEQIGRSDRAKYWWDRFEDCRGK